MTDTATRTNGVHPAPTPAPADPTRDYVAGGVATWATLFAKSLPQRVDDLATSLGADIYDRMQHDPAVSAALRVISVSILAHGYQLAPCEREDPDDQALAHEITGFVAHALNNLTIPFPDVLSDMLRALADGNRVAELVWTDSTWQKQRRLTLGSIKVKPRSSVAFAVDPFMNIIGILAKLPGQPFPVQSRQMLPLNPAEPPPNLLPRSKFAIWSHLPKDADPRGTSLLRPAYDWWWIKQMGIPEFQKFLSQFASASIIAKLGPNVSLQPNAAGVYPAEALLQMLLEYQNGSVAVVDHGTEVEIVQPRGGEVVWKFFYALCDAQITVAILLVLLATGTSEHQTNASTSEHANTLEDLISSKKQSLETMVERDIIRPLVLNNWGESALDLAPAFSLGAVEQQDLTPLITAIANLQRSGYIDDSQKAGLDVLLNLPPRTVVEEAAPETEEETDKDDSMPPIDDHEQEGDDGDTTTTDDTDTAAKPA